MFSHSLHQWPYLWDSQAAPRLLSKPQGMMHGAKMCKEQINTRFETKWNGCNQRKSLFCLTCCGPIHASVLDKEIRFDLGCYCVPTISLRWGQPQLPELAAWHWRIICRGILSNLGTQRLGCPERYCVKNTETEIKMFPEMYVCIYVHVFVCLYLWNT